MKHLHREIARDVLRAVDVYRQAVKPGVLAWYAEPYSGDWDDFDAKGQAYMWREMLEQPATGMWLSERPDSPTGYDVLYEGNLFEAEALNETNGVSFRLPTELMEERGPEWVRELALKLARELPYTSGHAGLCFHFPESVLGYTHAIRAHALRYPGLDIPGLSVDSASVGTRIKDVHWLNFLGPAVLEPLGGPAGLRARLHTPGTTVEELEEGRALVTLGAWPEAGDLEQGRDLPAWRELARVLEPWLYLGRSEWSGFSEEDMRRWERRFLD
ncbi:type VI immunity family protein [Melittangium boletus]|nr:type VI immunity family protein [Melittangium boletus]